MALWMVRAGRHGEHDRQFLASNRVYATWEGLDRDLSTIDDRRSLARMLEAAYPGQRKGAYANYAGQIWAFAHDIRIGDWVVVPDKARRIINVGEVTGRYVFAAYANPPYRHFHDVNWLQKDIPRTNFDQDLLHSFGAFMTVYRIRAEGAEERLKEMAADGWRRPSPRGRCEP